MLGLYDFCPFQHDRKFNKNFWMVINYLPNYHIAYSRVICVLLNFETTSFFLQNSLRTR
jgi:hypothetical protein